jgi:hypothetical protein
MIFEHGERVKLKRKHLRHKLNPESRHGKKLTKKQVKRIQAYFNRLGSKAMAGEDFDSGAFYLKPPGRTPPTN